MPVVRPLIASSLHAAASNSSKSIIFVSTCTYFLNISHAYTHFLCNEVKMTTLHDVPCLRRKKTKRHADLYRYTYRHSHRILKKSKMAIHLCLVYPSNERQVRAGR